MERNEGSTTLHISRKRCRSALSQDFELLASKFTYFSQEWALLKQRKGSLASKTTPAFQLALTRAMLDMNFGLKLPSMPQGRLCPPVANRWAYCEWILHELMPSLDDSMQFQNYYEMKNYGLDIGTGASAIYPLLLLCQDSKLHILASEVDMVSIQSAAINVNANNLQDRVTLIPIDLTALGTGGPLRQACAKAPVQFLDFIMTNPPFYDKRQQEQLPERADGRQRTPMTDTEGMYPGGEVGWVLHILLDSLTTLTAIGWYSTMVSKKSSFQTLKTILVNMLGLGRVRATEYDIGTMTRWFLAWTFHKVNDTSPAARTKVIEFQITMQSQRDPLEEVAQRVNHYLDAIPGLDLVYSHATCKYSILLTVTERLPPLPESFVVESFHNLEDSLVNDLNKTLSSIDTSNWLPDSGHFLIKLQVEKEIGNSVVTVKAEGYGHSPRGTTAVNSILTRLQGEVSRTNRRWRRLQSKIAK